MGHRLSIRKLAATAVPALETAPKFHSNLLRSKITWPKDVNWLRDTYTSIYETWSQYPTDPDVAYDPQTDEALYNQTAPQLMELVAGLEDVAAQRFERNDISRSIRNARYDVDTSASYGRARDFATATVYQSYALSKLRRLLDNLTSEANRKTGRVVRAYGYDVTGEVMEPGEQESRSPNLWDQGNSQKFDHTSENPANQMVDADAENDFPILEQTKHRHVNWPARSR